MSDGPRAVPARSAAPLLDIHGGRFDETVTTGQWSVDQVPGSVQLRLDVTRVPVRYVAYNGRAEVPEWLRTPAERPRVCLTPGISFGDVLGMHLVPIAESIEAMADLDVEVEVVATIGDDDVDKLGTLPDNVRAAGFVPLHALAPTCSAVIHHGGFGTWSTAALYGVPQLVVTIRHGDLWAKARRTAEAGAGLLRHATGVTVDSLREDVTRLRLRSTRSRPATPREPPFTSTWRAAPGRPGATHAGVRRSPACGRASTRGVRKASGT